MPTVSIIIPNYNHAPYLNQRIDSVLNQTYQDFEVIILDDVSPDNSREVIEQYRNHPKVNQVVFNTTNSGSTFLQWEKGIALAKGEYIWIAESDDWCENIFLDTIVAGLNQEPNCVFGYCQSYCVNNQGEIRWQSKHNKLSEYIDGSRFLEKFLLHNNLVSNASTVVFKKESYLQIADYYKSFKFCGDWVFWAELSRLGKVFVSAKPLNFFRKHSNDVSGATYKSGKNFIEELKALEYFVSNLNISPIEYRATKQKRYQHFLSIQHQFDSSIAKQINELFLKNETYGFKAAATANVLKKRVLKTLKNVAKLR